MANNKGRNGGIIPPSHREAVPEEAMNGAE